MENGQPKEITLDELARIMADGFTETRAELTDLHDEMVARFAAVDTRIDALGNRLDHKIDQLETKVDQLDTKVEDGFAAVRAVMGGMSHTLTDHEERIKELEGE